MNKKKIIFAVVASVLVITTVGGILAYGLFAESHQKDIPVSNPNQPEPILPNSSEAEIGADTNLTIPPIIPSDTERVPTEQKPNLEFDIGEYKPTAKNPSVDDVKVEYDTKEVERNE